MDMYNKKKVPRIYKSVFKNTFDRLTTNTPHFSLVLVFNETGGSLEVGVDHLFDERIEIDAPFPAKNALSFGRVAVEEP